ncbi:hypothetical protein LV89_00617 [Arcicella aurantiaca]|uniref:Uncharacterized protein n=1 Tax=Arcicella aurantiaca TaxID=591202 RepID=A0A316EDP9_9BACT|nr:hypothetical protein [Arcicella aurantiaca]PWK29063.1 hypothetical protein LV89_00617 [Arcicella aurantiaca]
MKTILKILFSITILYLFSCNKKPNGNNIAKLNFTSDADSVIVYIYDGLMGQSIVDLNGKIDTTIVTSKKLTNSEIGKLVTLLNIKRVEADSSMDYAEAACCSPHHGIIFYKNTKPSKWISLCFDCNCIDSTIPTDIRPAHFIDFITNLHLKVGNKELPVEKFGVFDRDENIIKINEKRYGKSYQSFRHNLSELHH